ncbi:hypothetical protein CDL12_22036 [Handroanthus impetiginosus]|uniref:Uncharacterized protein n=1 Tax=Handroanthus impetiginosus TaxID=429701 RepID=A0A2G9GJI8_9LAMI|nr:hypothetical protein CDL12_22036 [Handroanthus impetiginosus]
MRCKKHSTDLSSSVGVCASCLRERLFAIIAAQAQAQALKQQPPPVSFPRSVSPYISRRKLDAAAATWQLQGGGHHQLFFSTPQIGPTGSIAAEVKEKKKSKGGRFSSLFLGLFRSKLEKPDSDSGPISDPGVSIDSCSASPSWFSTIIPGRRKKKFRTFLIDESTTVAQRRTCKNRDRGMSPARYPDDEEEHCHGGSSGYSSESSQGWRQTPMRTTAAIRRSGGRVTGHSKNVASLAFCLSPLVRASPNCHWNQKGIPPEMVVAGESRVTPKPNLSAAASFCKNRSRKLADFGRYSHNPTR